MSYAVIPNSIFIQNIFTQHWLGKNTLIKELNIPVNGIKTFFNWPNDGEAGFWEFETFEDFCGAFDFMASSKLDEQPLITSISTQLNLNKAAAHSSNYTENKTHIFKLRDNASPEWLADVLAEATGGGDIRTDTGNSFIQFIHNNRHFVYTNYYGTRFFIEYTNIRITFDIFLYKYKELTIRLSEAPIEFLGFIGQLDNATSLNQVNDIARAIHSDQQLDNIE